MYAAGSAAWARVHSLSERYKGIGSDGTTLSSLEVTSESRCACVASGWLVLLLTPHFFGLENDVPLKSQMSTLAKSVENEKASPQHAAVFPSKEEC